jgi:hypothetical protein
MLSDYIQPIWINRQLNLKTPLEKCPVGVDQNIVGWHISKRMTRDLVEQALIKAHNSRKPAKGVVFHSDRGSQYSSTGFRNLLSQLGFRASMGDVGAYNMGIRIYISSRAAWGMVPRVGTTRGC